MGYCIFWVEKKEKISHFLLCSNLFYTTSVPGLSLCMALFLFVILILLSSFIHTLWSVFICSFNHWWIYWRYVCWWSSFNLISYSIWFDSLYKLYHLHPHAKETCNSWAYLVKIQVKTSGTKTYTIKNFHNFTDLNSVNLWINRVFF